MARKQKRYHYIYKTTCIITDKYYIGMHSTDNLEDGYKGSGQRLWYSINKHGWNNHETEILELLPNRNLLKTREIEIVNEELLGEKMCMNLALGGTGGILNKEALKKLHKNASANQIRNWENPEYRKRHTEILRLSTLKRWKDEDYYNFHVEIGKTSFLGKTHTDERKHQMSEKAKLRTGNKNSQFGTCWINKDKVNKKVHKSQLDKYLESGWTKGRINGNHN